jgi:hypothetical protein
MLVTGLGGTCIGGGQTALGEFAVECEGAEVIGQLGIVIADAHFELRRGWIRALGCCRRPRTMPRQIGEYWPT